MDHLILTREDFGGVGVGAVADTLEPYLVPHIFFR
jgi:hypothetical protein